jgi:hypothetical protein
MAHDRVDKASIYAREGVGYLWFVDPTARTLESLALDNGRWVRTGAWKDSDRVRAEPFDAIELELSELWAR